MWKQHKKQNKLWDILGFILYRVLLMVHHDDHGIIAQAGLEGTLRTMEFQLSDVPREEPSCFWGWGLCEEELDSILCWISHLTVDVCTFRGNIQWNSQSELELEVGLIKKCRVCGRFWQEVEGQSICASVTCRGDSRAVPAGGGWGFNLCSSALSPSVVSLLTQSLLVSAELWDLSDLSEAGGCSLPEQQKIPLSACGFCALQLSSSVPSGLAWALLVWDFALRKLNSFVPSCCTDLLLQNIFLLVICDNVNNKIPVCLSSITPKTSCGLEDSQFFFINIEKHNTFLVCLHWCISSVAFLEKKSVIFSTLLEGLEKIMRYVDSCITQNPPPWVSLIMYAVNIYTAIRHLNISKHGYDNGIQLFYLVIIGPELKNTGKFWDFVFM